MGILCKAVFMYEVLLISFHVASATTVAKCRLKSLVEHNINQVCTFEAFVFARILWVCVYILKDICTAMRPWQRENFKLLSWIFQHINTSRLFNLFLSEHSRVRSLIRNPRLWINFWIQIIASVSGWNFINTCVAVILKSLTIFNFSW